ncbi:MAG: hypothetical protein RMK50_04325 [Nitrososphaerota archaeon]|nr:hypothetical protein [Candidatus Bathyarchaeota archaeon]MDW8194027.1 hypothetical protein [Nitrososphaerota archaeon]
MRSKLSNEIKALDFIFENSPVKVIANRNLHEIKLVGLSIGPFEEGAQYEVPYWIASKLEKAGVVRFRSEDSLDPLKLYKIQWKERLQAAGQLSEFPKDFYPKFRRYLSQIKVEIVKNPEKMREYEKAKYLAMDIVNLRLKKILSLASTPATSTQIIKSLTEEERILYGKIHHLIEEWRNQLMKLEEEKEGDE